MPIDNTVLLVLNFASIDVIRISFHFERILKIDRKIMSHTKTNTNLPYIYPTTLITCNAYVVAEPYVPRAVRVYNVSCYRVNRYHMENWLYISHFLHANSRISEFFTVSYEFSDTTNQRHLRAFFLPNLYLTYNKAVLLITLYFH